MKDKGFADDVELKRINISHHDAEAVIYDRTHPELSSFYERLKVSKSVAFMAQNSRTRNFCVDIGCGTGFVTSFELPLYETVVVTDISRSMLEVVRKRYGHFISLNALVCDAEHLPLRTGIADLVSVSSVLHHLPKPFNSMTEMSRVLKQGGFLYVTRDPNFQRFRRFFDFFDHVIVKKLVMFVSRLDIFGSKFAEPNITVEGLDYDKANIHYPLGFQVAELVGFLRSKSFEVVSAYSYHWIWPDSDKGLLQWLLAKSNFFIEKIPLSKKFGRLVSIIARKLEEDETIDERKWDFES